MCIKILNLKSLKNLNLKKYINPSNFPNPFKNHFYSYLIQFEDDSKQTVFAECASMAWKVAELKFHRQVKYIMY